MPTTVDTDIALVSIDEAKEYLKIENSNADVILSHLINAVSSWVSNYLKRSLVSSEKTEYYSGDGSSELILKRYPVTAVSSVYVDSLRQWAANSLISSSNYIIKKQQGILKAWQIYSNWSPGDSNIKVTYTAGYTVATDGGDSGTLPYDIRLAVKRLIDQQYRIGYTNRKLDFQSESISGMNITFHEQSIGRDIKSMLDKWKKTIPSPQYEYED